MREIERRGGRKTSERHGPEFYKRIGGKGGTANATKYGHEHFAKIGRKGGQRMSELIAKAKAVDAERKSDA
ncbi:MAG: hypothetical protein ACYC3S_13275 [Chloroflexota bacterium]